MLVLPRLPFCFFAPNWAEIELLACFFINFVEINKWWDSQHHTSMGAKSKAGSQLGGLHLPGSFAPCTPPCCSLARVINLDAEQLSLPRERGFSSRGVAAGGCLSVAAPQQGFFLPQTMRMAWCWVRARNLEWFLGGKKLLEMWGEGASSLWDGQRAASPWDGGFPSFPPRKGHHPLPKNPSERWKGISVGKAARRRGNLRRGLGSSLKAVPGVLLAEVGGSAERQTSSAPRRAGVLLPVPRGCWVGAAGTPWAPPKADGRWAKRPSPAAVALKMLSLFPGEERMAS